MADHFYIEAETNAEMDAIELAIGERHRRSGARPFMGPRVYGSNCRASKLVEQQTRLVSFWRHADEDGGLVREGGVLPVTAALTALPVGDMTMDGGTSRLDLQSIKRSRSELTRDGQKLVDDIEARETVASR